MSDVIELWRGIHQQLGDLPDRLAAVLSQRDPGIRQTSLSTFGDKSLSATLGNPVSLPKTQFVPLPSPEIERREAPRSLTVAPTLPPLPRQAPAFATAPQLPATAPALSPPSLSQPSHAGLPSASPPIRQLPETQGITGSSRGVGGIADMIILLQQILRALAGGKGSDASVGAGRQLTTATQRQGQGMHVTDPLSEENYPAASPSVKVSTVSQRGAGGWGFGSRRPVPSLGGRAMSRGSQVNFLEPKRGG